MVTGVFRGFIGILERDWKLLFRVKGFGLSLGFPVFRLLP